MKVRYSKRFARQTKKLDKITLKVLCSVIEDVKKAKQVEDISNCVKLSGYKSVYRIRVLNHRTIFLLETADSIIFEYIAPRGGVYGKRYKNIIKGR